MVAGAASQLHLTANRPDGHLAYPVQAGGIPPGLDDSRIYTTSGDATLIGISDFAQDQLGEIVFVDIPEAGEQIEANQPFGSVESMKSVNELFMPFNDTVTAVNFILADTPSLINASCYEKGWIIRARTDSFYEAMSNDAYINTLV